MQKTIPIVALVGFLGSGKTSLLNQLLTQADGRKIAVIVNDYGSINIDAGLVAAQTDSTLELTNGCVCCNLDTTELDEAIARFTADGSQIDHIVIEASGLAEPADLSRVLSATSARLDALISLVDATQLPNEEPHRRLVHDAIKAGDLIVLTKTDIATPEQIATAKMFINDISPTSRIIESGGDKLPIDLLLDPPDPRPADRSEHHHHEHAHEQFESVAFTTSQPLDPPRFQQFVNRQLPTSIYRAKGWVNLGAKGQDHKYLFQLVGKRADISWVEWEDQTPITELVFIGKGFDSKQLLQDLEACIDPNPETTDPDLAIVARPD